MAQGPPPEKSEGTQSRPVNRDGQTFKIAYPPQATKAQYAGRTAAQGVLAAYQFADASRRDADRD
jgi:hypothetical protein